MSPTPTIPKIVRVKFTGASTDDPVTVTNNATGEVIIRDKKVGGKLLRLDSKEQSIAISVDNFVNGWISGNVLTVSIGGLTAGTIAITLTDATPQVETVTAVAVSTAVLSI